MSKKFLSKMESKIDNRKKELEFDLKTTFGQLRNKIDMLEFKLNKFFEQKFQLFYNYMDQITTVSNNIKIEVE